METSLVGNASGFGMVQSRYSILLVRAVQTMVRNK